MNILRIIFCLFLNWKAIHNLKYNGVKLKSHIILIWYMQTEKNHEMSSKTSKNVKKDFPWKYLKINENAK